jgi:hypothetical protein
MELKAAQNLFEEYNLIYDEKDAVNKINHEKFFINSLEVVHLPPFDDNSYDVNVYTIKEGKVIVFTIENAIKVFGKEL